MPQQREAPTKIHNLYLADLGPSLVETATSRKATIGNEIRRRIRLHDQLQESLRRFVDLAKSQDIPPAQFLRELRDATQKAEDLLVD
jgi:hypothetical protein